MLDPMGDRTITDLLTEQAESYGPRTFLIWEDKSGEISEYTYSEFDEQVRRCAGGLHDLGVGRHDFVVVNLFNRPEFLITWFAAARLGARLAPSNVANTPAELEHILNVTEARLVVTETALVDAVEQAISLAGSAPDVAIVGESAGEHISFATLMRSEHQPPEVEISSNDIAELIFTSGTTRKPKAAMLTHANCLRAGLDAVHCLWLDDGEKCLTALPMFHVKCAGDVAVRRHDRGRDAGDDRGVPGHQVSGIRCAATGRRRLASSRCSCARSWRSPSPRPSGTTRSGACSTPST